MLSYPVLLGALAFLAAGAGLVGISWSRKEHTPQQARWGRRLFLAMLAALSLGSLVLAVQPHRGLLYLGLAVGILIIAMLWEGRTVGAPETIRAG